MENIEEQKFETIELAIMALKDWAKEHGKEPTQEELDECIHEYLEAGDPNVYYTIINFLEDIENE